MNKKAAFIISAIIFCIAFADWQPGYMKRYENHMKNIKNDLQIWQKQLPNEKNPEKKKVRQMIITTRKHQSTILEKFKGYIDSNDKRMADLYWTGYTFASKVLATGWLYFDYSNLAGIMNGLKNKEKSKKYDKYISFYNEEKPKAMELFNKLSEQLEDLMKIL